jgi:hypothetical protein
VADGFPSLRWVWPRIDSLETAAEARKAGIFVAGLIAAGTIVLALSAPATRQNDDVLDACVLLLIGAGFYALIGWGIYKYSRFAAVSGLLLVVDGMWEAYSSAGRWGFEATILSAILASAFANGVRGTFAWHHYRKKGALSEPPEMRTDRAELVAEYEHIKEVLRRWSQPCIGDPGVPADEYDDAAASIYRMLESGADEIAVAEHLRKLCVFGSGTKPSDKDREIAAEFVKWWRRRKRI